MGDTIEVRCSYQTTVTMAKVALAGPRVRRGDVASTAFRDKSYVGLLSGTDVGAPIRDNTKTGVWNAS